jgi:hypothetical protein
VAGPLRRVRSAAAVRDGLHLLAVSAAQGRAGVLFAARRLIAPWALCPSTTEADVVREWLTWASVGMEGVVFKRLNDAYRPSVRGWQKYKNAMNCSY